LTYDFSYIYHSFTVPTSISSLVYDKSCTNTLIEQRLIGAMLGDGWLEKKNQIKLMLDLGMNNKINTFNDFSLLTVILLYFVHLMLFYGKELIREQVNYILLFILALELFLHLSTIYFI
jgi:hypothetical protein